jgi:predicted dehydrogenase
VAEVFARSVSPKGSGYRPDDNLSILLTMASGATAVITYHAMVGAALPKERITVTAGNRSFVVENFKSLHRYADRHAVSESTSQEKGFDEEVAAFVAGVKNGTMPIAMASLFNTTRATFAIEESLAKGVAVRMAG